MTRFAPHQASRTSTAALLALYLVTVGASGVVHLTPNGDPEWAIVVAAAGCLLFASGGVVGPLLARWRGESIAEQAESATTGMITASLGCGLLLSLGVRGHHAPLMFGCLAVAAVVGFGPVIVLRRLVRRQPPIQRGPVQQ